MRVIIIYYIILCTESDRVIDGDALFGGWSEKVDRWSDDKFLRFSFPVPRPYYLPVSSRKRNDNVNNTRRSAVGLSELKIVDPDVVSMTIYLNTQYNILSVHRTVAVIRTNYKLSTAV